MNTMIPTSPANLNALKANPPPAWETYRDDPNAAWARIARMIGAGLADYPDKELKEERGILYNLMVITCLLCGAKIPVDNKTWLGWIDGEITRVRKKRNG